MINISKWNESSFSMKLSDPKIEMMVKETGFVKGFNDGKGIDAFIILKKTIPYIDFDYCFKNVVVYHQPELTALEKARAIRPDHVVNSVAFYHTSKRNNGYKTGKIGHLYRHKLFDAKGNWVWTNWTVEKGGLLRLWLDNLFLKIGTPPFRIVPIGDTFGYTTAGGSEYPLSANWLFGEYATILADGLGTSLSFYGRNTSGSAMNNKGVIVLQSDKTIIANGVGEGIAVDSTSGWDTSTFSVAPSLTNGTTYCLMVIPDSGSGDYQFNYDAGGSGLYDSSNNYASPTNPVDGYATDMKFSIYCTYIPSGGGDIPAIPLGFIQGH